MTAGVTDAMCIQNASIHNYTGSTIGAYLVVLPLPPGRAVSGVKWALYFMWLLFVSRPASTTTSCPVAVQERVNRLQGRGKALSA